MNPLCLKTSSPAAQTPRGAGSDSEKLDPGYCAVFLHALVKCGVSTPPGICQEASIWANRACPAGSLQKKKKKGGGGKKALSIAIFPNVLCKCVSRRYGNGVRARFGTFFPWQRSASEGGILGAITEREFGGCDGEEEETQRLRMSERKKKLRE